MPSHSHLTKSTTTSYNRRMGKNKGNGQKRELPIGSWPETGGQKYESSKHSIWAHVIGQHHLPPVSGLTPTGTSRFSLLWSASTRFWPHFVAFCCSSPVYSIWPAWRRTITLFIRERQKAKVTETKSCSSTAAQQQLIALKIRIYSGVIFTPVATKKIIRYDKYTCRFMSY